MSGDLATVLPPGRPLVLVGCGRMGGAMLAGWLAAGIDPRDIIVVEPGPVAVAGPTVQADAAALPEGLDPAVVVLAVKPQAMDRVAPDYRRFVGPDTVFLSIAAGLPLGRFADWLGPARTVRAMPNTPAAIGRGVTALCPGPEVTDDQFARCRALLTPTGAVVRVDDEALMDAVTAVSGSGPAYVFWLTECLARAGAAAGLPADLAAELARHTVSGAGALMDRAEDDPATLRRNVTSPGGTTEAALKVLMAEDGLGPVLERAVAAATARGRELASE